MMRKRKITIDELEKMLNSDEDIEVTILPNGKVVTKQNKRKKKEKVLTYREKLGGEYG